MNSFENFLYEQKQNQQIDRIARHMVEINFPVKEFVNWFENRGVYLTEEQLDVELNEFLKNAFNWAKGAAGKVAGDIGSAAGKVAGDIGSAAGKVAGAVAKPFKAVGNYAHSVGAAGMDSRQGGIQGAAQDQADANTPSYGRWAAKQGGGVQGGGKQQKQPPQSGPDVGQGSGEGGGMTNADWGTVTGAQSQDGAKPTATPAPTGPIKSKTGGKAAFNGGTGKSAEAYDNARSALQTLAGRQKDVAPHIQKMLAYLDKVLMGPQQQQQAAPQKQKGPQLQAASGTAGAVDPNVAKMDKWQTDNKAAEIEAGRQPMVSHTVHNGNLFPESFAHRRTYESFKK